MKRYSITFVIRTMHIKITTEVQLSEKYKYVFAFLKFSTAIGPRDRTATLRINCYAF